MNALSYIRRTILAVCCAGLLPAPSQAMNPTAPQARPAPTGKEISRLVETMRKGMWSLQSLPEAQFKDSRGRSMVDDFNEWSLRPETVTALEEADKKAQPLIGDPNAYWDILDSLGSVIQAEGYRAMLVQSYWRGFNTIRLHASLLEPWAAGAPENARKAVQSNVNGTYADLVRLFERGIAEPSTAMWPSRVTELRDRTTSAAKSYNETRVAWAHAQQGKPGSPPLLSRDREDPCSEATQSLSGATAPSLHGEVQQPDAEDFYPVFMKNSDVEGVVVVRVQISATGCMQKAFVQETSGIPEMDQAALRYAEKLAYRPASRNNKPVSGEFPFRVRFKLSE